MSKILEELKQKMKDNVADFERINDGSSQSVDSFNLMLDEIFNPKLQKTCLTGTQEVQDSRLMIHMSLMWASQQGWQNTKVGTITRDYPVPSTPEICTFINDWINEQIASRYSPLVVALSHLSSMYAQQTRKHILER